MSTPRRVAVIVGSLRTASFSRKMALALKAMAPPSMALDVVEIGALPHYNQDDDAAPPPPSVAFRQAIAGVDAVLFVTPEYNRSVPGVLKNAIDIASRPYGKSAWAGKPAAIMSVSPGAIGAFGANHHLRQSLVFLDMPAMAQPEAYIGGAGDMFDEAGAIKKPETAKFMTTFLEKFESWIARNGKAAA